jgi:hypothetical protein
MRMHENIVSQVSTFTTLKGMWDRLKLLYGVPGLMSIFANFKKAIQMCIGEYFTLTPEGGTESIESLYRFWTLI